MKHTVGGPNPVVSLLYLVWVTKSGMIGAHSHATPEGAIMWAIAP